MNPIRRTLLAGAVALAAGLGAGDALAQQTKLTFYYPVDRKSVV